MINDLTKGSPAKVILLYSLPVILGSVFQQVYNFVDNIIVGRYVGFMALAGIGETTGVTFLILGFTIGITSGLGVRTAQYFGAGDMDNVRKSIGTSIIVSSAIALALTVLAVGMSGPLLHWMGVKGEIFSHAHGYVTVLFAGLFTQTAYNLISCILRALGDSRTPLYFLIFSSVLNVILDIIMVKNLGWGVEGAALATVLVQLLSALLCFVYAFVRYKEIRLSRKDFRTSWAYIWEHLAIGLPMAFQFSITALGLIFMNAALAEFPAQQIAGFSAANKITNLCDLVPVAFGVAMANYAGQNYGAGRMDRIQQGVKATGWMSMAVCAVVCFIMVVFSDQLTALFIKESAADNTMLFAASRGYLRVSAVFFPFLFMIFIYRNALQGIGYTFWPLMAGVGELVMRVAASFTLPVWLGYNGILMVDSLAWIAACLILLAAYKHRVKQGI